MKIFIAGATGVLGRRVVKGLISHGHQVLGLSRSKKNRQFLESAGAVAQDADLFDAESVLEASRGCEVFMHLATAIPSSIRTSAADWELNDRIRREGTQNLLDAAVAHGAKLYVQQSVSFVYGDRKDAWVDEKSRIPKELSEVLHSAVDLEDMVEQARDKKSLSTVILRCGHFYGVDCVHTQKMLHLIRKGSFAKVAGAQAYWNSLHIDDAASAFIAVVQKHDAAIEGRIFNVTDGEPARFSEIVDFLVERLDAKSPSSIPALMARLAVGKYAVEFSLMSMRVKSEKIRQVLSWTPAYPSFREGYQQILKS